MDKYYYAKITTEYGVHEFTFWLDWKYTGHLDDYIDDIIFNQEELDIAEYTIVELKLLTEGK